MQIYGKFMIHIYKFKLNEVRDKVLWYRYILGILNTIVYREKLLGFFHSRKHNVWTSFVYRKIQVYQKKYVPKRKQKDIMLE